MNLSETRKRLNAWVDLLTADQESTGRTWYRQAHRFARALADRYGLNVDRVVGVIACLSVQNRWDLNKRDAENLIRAWKEGTDLSLVRVGTYTGQRKKAIAILLADADADIYSLIGTKYAAKTRAFYSNILDPERSLAVTLDRWILRGLDLEYLAGGAGNRYVAAYRRIEALFVDVAQARGFRPHELQAAVWHCIQQTADAEGWEGSRPHTGLAGADTGADIPF